MRKLDLAQSQKSSRFLYVVKAYPIKSKLLKEYGFSLVSENPIPILLPGFFSDYLTDSIHFPPFFLRAIFPAGEILFSRGLLLS